MAAKATAPRGDELERLVESWGLDADQASEVLDMLDLFLEKVRDGSISERFFQLLIDKLADDTARQVLRRQRG